MKTDGLSGLLRKQSDRCRLMVAVLIPLAAFGLQWFFWAAIQPFVWFLFYPAVFLSSWVGGLRGGLVATGLSTGLVWYFFIPPQVSFAVQRPTAFLSIAVFAGMGVLFSFFHERMRKANQRAAEALAAAQSAKDELEARVTKRTADLLTANELLREGEAQLRTLGDNIPGGALYQLLAPPDGRNRFTYMSAGIERIFGIPADRVLADPEAFWDRIVEEDRPRMEAAQTKSARDLTVFDCELRQRTIGDEIKWVHCRSTPRRLDDGSILWDGVVADITGRKQAEQQLRESEERFRMLVDVAPEAIFIQTKGCFAYVNDAALRLFGATQPAELLGQPVLSRIHPDYHARTLERIKLLNAQRQRAWAKDMVFITVDGSARDVITSGVPFSYQNENGALVFAVDITGRKRVEQDLLESTALLRVAGRIARFGGWSVKLAEGRVLWSDEVAAIHETPPGFSPSLTEGINFYAPEYRERITIVFGDCVRDGKAYDEELQIITARGRRVWVRTVGQAVRNSTGAIIEVQGAFQDITERKQAEEVLQRSEARRRIALDAAQAGTWEWDLATNQNIWSDELWKLYGLEPNSCTPSYEAWLESVHPEDRERVEQTLKETVGREAELNLEWRTRDSADGGGRWLMSRGRPLRDASGHAVRYLGVVVDITERTRAEKALQQTHNTLVEAQKIAHLGSFEYIAATRTTVWSEEEYRIYGLDPTGPSPAYDEMLARHIHPDDVALLHESFSRAMQNRSAYDLKHRIVRPDGSMRWVHDLARPYFDGQGELLRYVGTTLDITERKRAEDEVHRLNAELEQRVQERTIQFEAANRDLESFAYAVSHDLRAPLRAMNGFSQALLEDFGATLPGAAREHLDEIILGSRHMGELIDGLLRLSRSTRGEIGHDVINLSALATRILDGLAAAEPDRRVTWSVEPGLTARGDERMIEVLLANLLGNAWKYTASTPQPKIEVGVMGDGEDAGAPPSHHFSVFFVRDNGAGFDMKYAARLFQPFQRLHRQEEFLGIGIGLATVQRIVHRHGGTIRASAIPGQGATFCFSLPSADGNDEERP